MAVLGKRLFNKLLQVATLSGLVLACNGLLMAASESDLAKIERRIAPVGEVCMLGDPCAGGAGSAAGGAMASAGGAQDPQQIYQTYCFACHGTGANNSPVLGDQEAWAPRVEKGVDVLYQNAINGFNNGVMPAKGLCMSCSDADVQATVDYMLDAL